MEEKENITADIPAGEAAENADETIGLQESSDDEYGPRPAPDPKSKLYTFISILIGIAVYFGWNAVRNNIYFTYSLYKDSFTDNQQTALIQETGYDPEALPDSNALKYARLHHDLTADTLYIVMTAEDMDIDDTDEDAQLPIPFEYSISAEDERFEIFPNEDMTADYVYGNSYVDIADPRRMCMIYEYNGSTIIEFRVTKFDMLAEKAMRDGIKTKIQ